MKQRSVKTATGVQKPIVDLPEELTPQELIDSAVNKSEVLGADYIVMVGENLTSARLTEQTVNVIAFNGTLIWQNLLDSE